MDKILILTVVIIIVIIICTVQTHQTQYDYNYLETNTNVDTNNDDLVAQLPIYVINLKDRPDRKLIVDKVLDQYGLKPTYVDAVDGKKLDVNDLIKNKVIAIDGDNGGYLRRGEYGCSFSHFKSWMMIKDSGAEYGLIFEDDAKLVPGFRNKLNAILHATYNLDWDIIYLGRYCYYHNHSIFWHKRGCIDGKTIIGNLFYPNIVGYGNFAYIIRTSSIDKIMQYMFPIQKPIDVILPQLYARGIIKAVALKDDIAKAENYADSDTTKIK